MRGAALSVSGPVELMVKILRERPSLPGARCVGRHELFDGHTAEDRTAALELCRRCPARAPCESWANDERNLVGVVGGKFRGDAGDRTWRRTDAKLQGAHND